MQEAVTTIAHVVGWAIFALGALIVWGSQEIPSGDSAAGCGVTIVGIAMAGAGWALIAI